MIGSGNPLVRGVLLGAALAACGGTGAGATFHGTVKGQAFAPADAISSPATAQFSVGTAGVAAIVLSGAVGLCAKVSANTEPRSTQALVLLLTDVNLTSLTGSVPSGTGVYTVYDFSAGGVPPAHLAYLNFGVNDASCVQDASKSATGKSGSVTLTRNASGAYSGSFDVTFDSGDHVSGSFDTASCAGLQTYLGTSAHGCG
jgi:hypothetical protein